MVSLVETPLSSGERRALERAVELLRDEFEPRRS
jgi:hypothetical protein